MEALRLALAFPNLNFQHLTNLVDPGDGSNRLFATEQDGRITVFPSDAGTSEALVFLDISDKVSTGGNEEGLLGLAFDPAFVENGRFYVYYSASGPRRSVISSFAVDPNNPDRADRASERVILEVEQPASNHNGGQLAFGPDGYFYVGLGDGGGRGDPSGNGQNPGTLFGSILRLDVSGEGYQVPSDNPLAGVAGARDEIWAYGFRNPWRFSFDRVSGDLWAADVGQNAWEEVDIVRPGLNYGWNVMEGFACFEPRSGCDQTGLQLPVVTYGREHGCSITGGYVYRGERLPSLQGAYVYGDFCSGKIWSLRYDGSVVTEHHLLIDSDLQITSFAQDSDGDLYVLSRDSGIFRLESE
ncbi:MAG: Glucose/arabinose dehydrogenase, beta-propeller fold [Chloroflexi bacterium]|nr:MAG: Glucose/arabinose dehydrogenase, beta-propeller fold [Chloroflexota bacterium]